MIAIRLNDLKQYSDVLLTRSGKPFTVRFVEPRDARSVAGLFPLALGSLPLQPFLRRHERTAGGRSSITLPIPARTIGSAWSR